MIQVIDQMTAIQNQISDMGNRMSDFASTSVRRHELDGLRMDLREIIRDEVQHVLQPQIKRSSDHSQSPAQRPQFASPAVLQNHSDHGTGRFAAMRQVDGQFQRDGVPYSPSGSHHSDAAASLASRGTPQQPQYRNLAPQKPVPTDVDPSLQHFDPLEGQLSIPNDHSTGAHKLLIGWDAIHPLYHGIIDKEYATHYVWREETQRGQLRVFGQGEGHDGINRSKTAPLALESPVCSDAGSSRSGSLPADGFWGFGFDGAKTRPVDSAGGLDIDGSLRLDTATLKRLFSSFMDNMWVMHPFINQVDLRRMFEKFVRQYGRGETFSPSSSFSAAADGNVDIKYDESRPRAPKRKRSDGRQEDGDTPGKVSSNMPIEHGVSNAVILLVLALGRICEHKDRLPAPVFGDVVPPSTHDALSPLDLGRATNGMSRTGSTDSQLPPPPKPIRYARNIDKLPGLAYWAYATEILGEQFGAPDLAHVHARLLAGLYMGQIARIIDSWTWIHSACVGCQLLFEDET